MPATEDEVEAGVDLAVQGCLTAALLLEALPWCRSIS